MTDIRYIYGLVDPRTFEIKYIGITKDTKNRLFWHIRDSKKRKEPNIHKGAWIRQLLNLNLIPEIIVLEVCSKEDVSNAEIWWISLCKNIGFNLTNLTDGGDFPPDWEGKSHSKETREKQSKSIRAYYSQHFHPGKGKKQSPELVYKRTIESRKTNGTYRKMWPGFTEERVKKVYQKRSENEEWRKNLSISNKKRLSDPTKNPMYGKHQSTESKEKNRLTNMMYNSDKKGDYFSLCELQEDYFEVAGKYQPNYAEFSYQSF